MVSLSWPCCLMLEKSRWKGPIWRFRRLTSYCVYSKKFNFLFKDMWEIDSEDGTVRPRGNIFPCSKYDCKELPCDGMSEGLWVGNISRQGHMRGLVSDQRETVSFPFWFVYGSLLVLDGKVDQWEAGGVKDLLYPCELLCKTLFYWTS